MGLRKHGIKCLMEYDHVINELNVKNAYSIEVLGTPSSKAVNDALSDVTPDEVASFSLEESDSPVTLLCYDRKRDAQAALRVLKEKYPGLEPHLTKPTSPATFLPINEPDMRSGRQRYLVDTNIHRLWDLPGGRGDNVQIIDIQAGWAFSHPDLLSVNPPVEPTINYTRIDWLNHGTNSLSIMGARANGQGMTGGAPSIGAIQLVGTIFKTQNNRPVHSLVVALDLALRLATPGDVVSIPYQTNSNYPVHTDSSKTWQRVELLVQRGVTVVEAAGNMLVSLPQDSSSGIVVGGAVPTNMGYMSYNSNFGPGVDCYAPANSLWCLGFVKDSMNRPRYSYGHYYSNSSAATGVIASGIACLQSHFKEMSGQPVHPLKIRAALHNPATMSYQVESGRGIPDFMKLRAMLA